MASRSSYLPLLTFTFLLLFSSVAIPLALPPASLAALFRESGVFQGLIARASCPPFELRADRI